MFSKFFYTLFYFKRKRPAKNLSNDTKEAHGLLKCLEADSPVSLQFSTKASVVVYLFWTSVLQQNCPCFLETYSPDRSLHTAERAMISTVRHSQIFQYLHWEAKNEQNPNKQKSNSNFRKNAYHLGFGRVLTFAL